MAKTKITGRAKEGGPLTALQILNRADIILSSKKRWAQGTFAKDRNGWAVSARADDATCFCVLGSLTRACLPFSVTAKEYYKANDIMMAAAAQLYLDTPAGVNDKKGYAAVRKLLAFAKKLARTKQYRTNAA